MRHPAALGAGRGAGVPGPADRDAFGTLLGELERGVVRSVAFVVSGNAGWPLPIYELAMLTATRVKQCAVDVEVVLVTPEAAPLAMFGAAASEVVSAVLADRGITLHTGRYASRYRGDRLELFPGSTLRAERVVALPRLEGSQILGIPQDADGFIATDSSGRVHGLSQVYAAGDITRFPIKQGGIAAQQADALAELIAERAGAPVKPEPFRPVLRALLLTGGAPLYLRSEPTRGHGHPNTVATEPLWWPAAKIAGRYLAPFLAGSFDQLTHTPN